jgi:NAD(P)-dependent dehydrogenase (short-subunit alcohol dehydrogenase family)
MIDFSNKTVVVTGGTKGIGVEIVRRFSGLGANVVAGARTEGDIAELLGPMVAFRPVDVRDLEQMRCLTSFAIERFGHVDVFVNSAGLSIWRTLDKVDSDFFDAIMDTNLKGCYWGCKAAAEVLQSGGCIINVASLAGKRGSVNNSVYCASKFGVVGLTQALAKELGPRGIRVNSVCPVYVRTDALLANLTNDHPEVGDKSPESFLEFWAKQNCPLGRLPETGEIADLCVYLASPMASALTGQNINIDCGVLPQ